MAGHPIDTSFGSLTQLAEVEWFLTLLEQHNDEEDDFHFDLFSPVIIGCDIKVESDSDILHLNITSMRETASAHDKKYGSLQLIQTSKSQDKERRMGRSATQPSSGAKVRRLGEK